MTENINLNLRNYAWICFLQNMRSVCGNTLLSAISSKVINTYPELNCKVKNFTEDWIFGGMKTTDDLMNLDVYFEHLDSGKEICVRCQILHREYSPPGDFSIINIFEGALRYK